MFEENTENAYFSVIPKLAGLGKCGMSGRVAKLWALAALGVRGEYILASTLMIGVSRLCSNIGHGGEEERVGSFILKHFQF